MLDLKQPQTRHIFAASRLQDAVMDGAKRIIVAQPSERPGLLSLCEQSITAMRTLNTDHFGSSESIATTIQELEAALQALATSASPSWDIIGIAFARLESDEGFGTVWI